MSMCASASDTPLWAVHSSWRARSASFSRYSWRFFLSDSILSLSCRDDTHPKSRSFFPLNSDRSTLEEDPSHRCSFPQLPTSEVCQRFITLDDAGRCWLPLAAACWKTAKGICTHFSLLREQWWSQLSCFNGFCYVRRNNGRNVINVGGEAVLPWREVNRCVLAGDLDQVFGLMGSADTLPRQHLFAKRRKLFWRCSFHAVSRMVCSRLDHSDAWTRCLLSILWWDSAQPFGQTVNHSVDRRKLCLTR